TRSIWRRTSSRCSTVRSPASIEPQRSSGSKSRKGNGKQMRAIGIRTFEDKVLQRAVANADDFVFVFEREQDARRVLEVLPKRFERFGLTLHPDKTRLLDFRRPDRRKDDDDGDSGGGNRSFDLLRALPPTWVRCVCRFRLQRPTRERWRGRAREGPDFN